MICWSHRSHPSARNDDLTRKLSVLPAGVLVGQGPGAPVMIVPRKKRLLLPKVRVPPLNLAPDFPEKPRNLPPLTFP